MSTFEVKMIVLQALGNSWTLEEAEQAYQWIMSEVEISENTQGSSSVTQLTPVN